jgi:hypothetical protein
VALRSYGRGLSLAHVGVVLPNSEGAYPAGNDQQDEDVTRRVAPTLVSAHVDPSPKRGAVIHRALVGAEQDSCTILAVKDYAGAWSAERGRCHRFVYTSDDDGCPMNCPLPPVTSGCRRDGGTPSKHVGTIPAGFSGTHEASSLRNAAQS